MVIFDGGDFPDAILNYIRNLHQEQSFLLTGVFLPSMDYAVVANHYYGKVNPLLTLEEYEEDAVLIRKNMDQFSAFCEQHHIRHKIHQNLRRNIAEELQQESRFADLIILSSHHFYSNLEDSVREEYLEETLHRAECPLVLLPDNYHAPERIIFAYDGSASCMFALKQFIYLFPAFTDLDLMVVYAAGKEEAIPDLALLKEYAAPHFSSLAYYRLDKDTGEALKDWVEHKGSGMVVSGAFGRSSFSRLFRKSFIRVFMQGHNVPLFIAHA